MKKNQQTIIANETVLVQVSELKGYDKNPRRGNVKAIAESLEINKQYRPIVVQKSTKKILAGKTDIAFFGSDWIHANAGKIYHKMVVIDGVPGGVQDFVIVANRSQLKPGKEVIDYITSLPAKKRRSGNNLFKLLILLGYCVKPG